MLSKVIHTILFKIIQSLDTVDLNLINDMIEERKDILFQDVDGDIMGKGNIIRFIFENKERTAVIIPQCLYETFMANTPKPSGKFYIAQDIDNPKIYYTVNTDKVKTYLQEKQIIIDPYNSTWVVNVVF